MKIYIMHIICIILFIQLISCKADVTQEELIQSALVIKIGQWREGELKTCTEKAMAAAEAYVDSVLLIRSLATKLDTISKPPKPNKPPKPVFRTKPDSIVVKKINENDK